MESDHQEQKDNQNLNVKNIYIYFLADRLNRQQETFLNFFFAVFLFIKVLKQKQHIYIFFDENVSIFYCIVTVLFF